MNKKETELNDVWDDHEALKKMYRDLESEVKELSRDVKNA